MWGLCLSRFVTSFYFISFNLIHFKRRLQLFLIEPNKPSHVITNQCNTSLSKSRIKYTHTHTKTYRRKTKSKQTLFHALKHKNHLINCHQSCQNGGWKLPIWTSSRAIHTQTMDPHRVPHHASTHHIKNQDCLSFCHCSLRVFVCLCR